MGGGVSIGAYPDYRSVKTALGNVIPSHWRALELRWVATLKSGESIDASDIHEAGDYPVFGGGGMRGYATGFTHDGFYPLVGRQGALCGNINYGRGRFWASEHSVVVTPTEGIHPYWLGETLRAMNLNQYSVSAAQPGLSVDAIRRLRVPVPSLDEQRQIAGFLSRETAKIDALVAEQQQLVELLKEKRQAAISHAVTKGLNPDTPVKDSGVEWLVDVPAHWTMKRIKYLSTSVEQGWSPQCESYPADLSDEWGVLKVGAVNRGTFSPEENKKLPSDLEALPELSIKFGDLMISRANTRELVGSAAVSTRDYPRLLLCDKLYRLRFRDTVTLPPFLAFYLSTPAVREQIELHATGASASMVNIGQSVILELPVAVPPLEERVTMLKFIDAETITLNALVQQAETAIRLLKERRAALITAAITGEIDVCTLASAEAA